MTRRTGHAAGWRPQHDPDRTAAANEARRRATGQKLQQVRDAIAWLRRYKTPVTYPAAARRAAVSRTFLYDNTDARALMDALGQRTPHGGSVTRLNRTPRPRRHGGSGLAGYVPVLLSPGDYIELLPAGWRVINSYGVKIGLRTYDSGELNPYRRQHSGMMPTSLADPGVRGQGAIDPFYWPRPAAGRIDPPSGAGAGADPARPGPR